MRLALLFLVACVLADSALARRTRRTRRPRRTTTPIPPSPSDGPDDNEPTEPSNAGSVSYTHHTLLKTNWLSVSIWLKLQGDIVACTSDSGCECADTTQGFQTYTFQHNGQQRCFTTYIPVNRQGEVLPVFFTPQCYAKDKLTGIGATNNRTSENPAAARYVSQHTSYVIFTIKLME